MASRPSDSRKASTPDRLKQELADAEAEVRKILAAAPRALEKYPVTQEAGQAVFRALTAALARISDAEVKLSRWHREGSHGGR